MSIAKRGYSSCVAKCGNRAGASRGWLRDLQSFGVKGLIVNYASSSTAAEQVVAVRRQEVKAITLQADVFLGWSRVDSLLNAAISRSGIVLISWLTTLELPAIPCY